MLTVSFWGIPYSTFMIKGFVENIPRELDEAIYMDGGSALTVFGKIFRDRTY